jgi:hypothetical protein
MRKKRDHKKAVARYKQRVATERNQLQKQVMKMMEERNKELELEKQQSEQQQ